MSPARKKEREDAAPHQEIDAVKGFIVVMFVLILALTVFIVITSGRLATVEQDGIGRVQRDALKLNTTAQEIQGYLKLIKDSEETVLQKYPERFFGKIYQSCGIAPGQVTVGPQRDTKNVRQHYTEISWDLDITGITREQAAKFLHGVETDSPKAYAIEASMRRSRAKDAGEDQWDARFKIGYRVAGTSR